MSASSRPHRALKEYNKQLDNSQSTDPEADATCALDQEEEELIEQLRVVRSRRQAQRDEKDNNRGHQSALQCLATAVGAANVASLVLLLSLAFRTAPTQAVTNNRGLLDRVYAALSPFRLLFVCAVAMLAGDYFDIQSVMRGTSAKDRPDKKEPPSQLMAVNNVILGNSFNTPGKVQAPVRKALTSTEKFICTLSPYSSDDEEEGYGVSAGVEGQEERNTPLQLAQNAASKAQWLNK